MKTFKAFVDEGVGAVLKSVHSYIKKEHGGHIRAWNQKNFGILGAPLMNRAFGLHTAKPKTKTRKPKGGLPAVRKKP